MLVDRKPAASRRRWATGMAIRGAIFTFGFISTASVSVPEAARSLCRQANHIPSPR
jgi:hypothetical protein